MLGGMRRQPWWYSGSRLVVSIWTPQVSKWTPRKGSDSDITNLLVKRSSWSFWIEWTYAWIDFQLNVKGNFRPSRRMKCLKWVLHAYDRLGSKLRWPQLHDLTSHHSGSPKFDSWWSVQRQCAIPKKLPPYLAVTDLVTWKYVSMKEEKLPNIASFHRLVRLRRDRCYMCKPHDGTI